MSYINVNSLKGRCHKNVATVHYTRQTFVSVGTKKPLNLGAVSWEYFLLYVRTASYITFVCCIQTRCTARTSPPRRAARRCGRAPTSPSSLSSPSSSLVLSRSSASAYASSPLRYAIMQYDEVCRLKETVSQDFPLLVFFHTASAGPPFEVLLNKIFGILWVLWISIYMCHMKCLSLLL